MRSPGRDQAFDESGPAIATARCAHGGRYLEDDDLAAARAAEVVSLPADALSGDDLQLVNPLSGRGLKIQGEVPCERLLNRLCWFGSGGHRGSLVGTETAGTIANGADPQADRSAPLPPRGVRLRRRLFDASEWDPGIVEATKLTVGPVREGSEFDIVALFRGKQHRFRYVVTALETDRRAVLSGDVERAHSVDEVTLEPDGEGTRITYVADFRLKGLFRPAGPFLLPVMNRMADDALEGLEKALGPAR